MKSIRASSKAFVHKNQIEYQIKNKLVNILKTMHSKVNKVKYQLMNMVKIWPDTYCYCRRIIRKNALAILLLNNTGIIQKCSKRVEKITGYQSEEIAGKHFSIFFPANKRQ